MIRIYKIFLTTLVLTASATLVFSQDTDETDSVSAKSERQDINHPHSIGSSLFMLGNFAPGDPPHYFQLNYGYRFTQKDAIIIEAITWTYYEPLGTYENSEEKYPGKVSAYGIGLGYQRFHWKNLYTTVQATPFLQKFYDTDDIFIQNGFQLFLQLRIGYRFEFLKKRWFIEPSVAFNYWPINTNFPPSFEEIEEGAPNYYLFEPGLHFGYRF